MSVMEWRQTYTDRAERAKRLKPLVKEGSILVLMEDIDFRWATYRIREIYVSRSGSQHYYVDNSYNCNTTGRCENFSVEEPRRGWSEGDGSVYEIFLHDAIAVFPDEEAAQPLIQQLMAEEAAYIEATRAARERFAVFVKLIASG